MADRRLRNHRRVPGEFPLEHQLLSRRHVHPFGLLFGHRGADRPNYNVERSTTSGSGYVTIATGVSSTAYCDSNNGAGLTNGVTYYYVVTAENPCGVSSESNEASATPESSFNGTIIFTTQAPAASYTDGPYELGVKFQSSQAGQIISVRDYEDASETGTRTGHVWSASGTPLATVAFGNETSSGRPRTLATSVSNPPLSTVADGDNGLFGSPGAFPTNSYQISNYFRDLVFQCVTHFTAALAWAGTHVADNYGIGGRNAESSGAPRPGPADAVTRQQSADAKHASPAGIRATARAPCSARRVARDLFSESYGVSAQEPSARPTH
jgi:hypothetical protein